MKLGLRFISGKYQGGQYLLEEGKVVRIGRSSGLEMVLVEEMVSRHHASLHFKGGRVHIQDHGSTNGTFVNGERITKASIGEGDRILIGSNILKIMPLADDREVAMPPGSSRGQKHATGGYGARSERRMSGNLEDISLPDLLQLFGVSKKSGVLVLQQEATTARIVLKEGLILHAEIETRTQGRLPVAPIKVAYRLLNWEKGRFELGPEAENTDHLTLQMSAQELLMEGFRQKDEFARVEADLPALDSQLEAEVVGKLSELESLQLDVWQVASRAGTVEATLNNSQHSDADTAVAIVRLLKAGFLRAVPPSRRGARSPEATKPTTLKSNGQL